MKKVGIMTFHLSESYGAVLQCYALRHFLNTLPNIQAEVINYNPGLSFSSFDNQEIQTLYNGKIKKFEEFGRCGNGISGKTLWDIHTPEAMQYDYYVTGSDQVWNTSFDFVNKAYFLDFVPEGRKKIAYAASIAIPADSPKLKRDWFEKYIPSFDYLSIREESHLQFLKQFTEKEVCTAVDPVFLLDTKDYDELCQMVSYPKGDYIALFLLGEINPHIVDFVNLLSRKFKLKVLYSDPILPDRTFKYESETFCYAGPKEFIQIIRHAKAVITNSFHATVFAIKYHVPFFTYPVKGTSSRMTALLRELELDERLIYGFRRLDDKMLDIDFSQVDKILEKKREPSIRFLKTALAV